METNTTALIIINILMAGYMTLNFTKYLGQRNSYKLKGISFEGRNFNLRAIITGVLCLIGVFIALLSLGAEESVDPDDYIAMAEASQIIIDCSGWLVFFSLVSRLLEVKFEEADKIHLESVSKSDS